jgi:hypothetical protein
VRAQAVLVLEELRLFEHAHHAPQLQHRLGEFRGITANVQITLWRGVLGEGRGVPQIQHHVKRGLGFARLAAKIDGPHGITGGHAVAVGFATRQVDLITQVNRLLRAHRDAGVAACAEIQVNRIRALPGGLKGAQPPGEGDQLATLHFAVVPLPDARALPHASHTRRCCKENRHVNAVPQ